MLSKHPLLCSLFLLKRSICLSFIDREEKTEQLMDSRQELDSMEVELKRIQQEVECCAVWHRDPVDHHG